MMRLKGASELRRLVLKKWSSSTIKEGSGGYVRKFPCPQCGGKASETYSKVLRKGELWWWAVDWESRCGYVFDSVSDQYVGSPLIPVEKHGVTVGLIDPSSPPPWPRFEPPEHEENGVTEFDTLWQAMNASVEECRLLGAIQESERRRLR